MKVIGVTGAHQYVFYGNGFIRIELTNITISNIRDEAEALEVCKRNIAGFRSLASREEE